VKVRDFNGGEFGSDLSGRVLLVRQITCSISTPEQRRAIWRCHFADGRCVEWHRIERFATSAEIARATRKAA
jgi:hypothetical protein